MNICSYTPTKYLDNRDINDKLRFLFKTVCGIAAQGIPGSGTVTSIAVSMPAAFSVANSPITTNGTIAITGAGTTAQYIRGDGTLATYGNASVTKAQRNAIAAPAAGLIVYQTDNIPGLRVYNGTNWVRFTETID